LDNIQITLPDPEVEVLLSFVRAEQEQPCLVSRNSEGNLIYGSREMQQDELGFPILCDLGSAVIERRTSRGLIQALPYRAPEVILGADWDAKVDVRNVGVLVSFSSIDVESLLTDKVWELVFGERLFGQENELNTIRLMVQYLGSPPKSLLERCTRGTEFFDEQGTLVNS
jgi:hypothetical protein